MTHGNGRLLEYCRPGLLGKAAPAGLKSVGTWNTRSRSDQIHGEPQCAFFYGGVKGLGLNPFEGIPFR